MSSRVIACLYDCSASTTDFGGRTCRRTLVARVAEGDFMAAGSEQAADGDRSGVRAYDSDSHG